MSSQPAGLTFTESETAAIITGLRLLQRTPYLSPDLTEVLEEPGTRLDDDALDDLCERINFEGSYHPDVRKRS